MVLKLGDYTTGSHFTLGILSEKQCIRYSRDGREIESGETSSEAIRVAQA